MKAVRKIHPKPRPCMLYNGDNQVDVFADAESLMRNLEANDPTLCGVVTLSIADERVFRKAMKDKDVVAVGFSMRKYFPEYAE